MELATKSDIEKLKTELLQEIRKIKEEQSTKTTPSRFLKSNEVCEIFKISPTKLFEMRRKDEIPCLKVGGSYLYNYQELLTKFKSEIK